MPSIDARLLKDEENPVDASLRANVRLLGDSLGRTIARDLGDDFLEQIETIRKYAKRDDNGVKLHQYLRQLPDDRLLPVARAFNQFLQLANIAEQHHRVSSKCVDDDSRTAVDRLKLTDVFKRVQQENPDGKQLLFETFAEMRIELVLTAHPTETIRRTLIRKYDLIEECLGVLERLHPDAKDEFVSETAQRTRERLEELISQAWHTNEFRRERPSPVDGKLVVVSRIRDAHDELQRPNGVSPSSRIPSGTRCRRFPAISINYFWRRPVNVSHCTQHRSVSPRGWAEIET